MHGQYFELEGVDAKAKLHDFSLGIKELIRINEHKKLSFIHEFSSKLHEGKVPVVFQIKELEITGRKKRE